MIAIPRKFKLLEEYENATHGKGDPSCSYGLEVCKYKYFSRRYRYDQLDVRHYRTVQCNLSNKTNFDNRIYSLRVVTDKDYPVKAPTL